MTDGSSLSGTGSGVSDFFKALGFAILPILGLLVALRRGSRELRLMDLHGCTFVCRGDPLERAAPELLWAGGFGLLCVVSVVCVVVGTRAAGSYTRKRWMLFAFPFLVLTLALATRLQQGPF